MSNNNKGNDLVSFNLHEGGWAVGKAFWLKVDYHKLHSNCRNIMVESYREKIGTN